MFDITVGNLSSLLSTDEEKLLVETYGQIMPVHTHIHARTYTHMPTSVVAQLNAHPTGDQEVAGSIPDEVGNILSWKLIMKYFLRSFSPFR